MQTDSIFYRLFKEFPSIFFELIGNSPETASLYNFSSVEVKQTAFRIDGVFLPTEVKNDPIYFVEVQFQTDKEIYSRLVSETCLYLRQNKPKYNWRAVVIFPNRSLDTESIEHYQEFFDSQRIKRIYLDELGEDASLPIGIATIKLVIEDEDKAIVAARELIDRIQQNTFSSISQAELLQLIETILFYKFPTMSRQEVERMFGLSDLKKTRVYQEAYQEGEYTMALKLIPVMLAVGLNIEQIAAESGLNVEEIKQIMQQQSLNSPGNS